MDLPQRQEKAVNKQPRSKPLGIGRRNNLNRQGAKDAKFYANNSWRPLRLGG